MRMVYTEFLYSFIRDFLTINGVENNKLSVSWVYLLIRKSQPCAKEHREISGPRRSYYRNHQPLRSICMCCHYMLAQQHVKKKKKKKQRRLLCIERNLFLQVEIFSSIFIPPQCLAVGENTVKWPRDVKKAMPTRYRHFWSQPWPYRRHACQPFASEGSSIQGERL